MQPGDLDQGFDDGSYS